MHTGSPAKGNEAMNEAPTPMRGREELSTQPSVVESVQSTVL